MKTSAVALLVVVGTVLGFVVGRQHHRNGTVTTITAKPDTTMELTAGVPVPVLAAIRKLISPDPALPDQIDPTKRGVWIHDTQQGNVEAFICDAVNGSEVVVYDKDGRRLSFNVYPTAAELLDPNNPSLLATVPRKLIPYLLIACP